MKDKEWNEKKDKVRPIFDKWIDKLGLKWYEIELLWKSGDGQDRGDGFVCAMEVRSRWEYRTASILIWLAELPENDDEKLERMIVHELCHILIEPMRNGEVTKNEEAVAEALARAFLWTEASKKK